MARITVDDCLKRISNRFQLTLAATYRARQLGAGASPLVEPNRDKSTVIALRELAAGFSNQEIAERLFISESTVKFHVHSILEKLNLSDRRDVAMYAREHGLLK